MVELRDLHSFQVLAAELHFGRAAEFLGINTSTLTRRITSLEGEIGVPLFARTSRSVRLTDSGRELAARLPKVMRALDAMLAAARASDEAVWEV